jgi:hypothetical protein
VTTTSADLDFHEAMYVYSLDAGRFDMLHKLATSGAQVRRCVVDRVDLTPRGQAIYDSLGTMPALADAPMTVVSRPRRCHDVATKHADAPCAKKQGAQTT